MFESWRKALLVLASCVVFIGVVWYVVGTVQVPHYSNMTDAQSNQQTDRWYEVQAQACQDAGGQWLVGFSTAGCSIAYPAPDTNWYVTPKDNPNYLPWHFGSSFLIALAMCAAMVALVAFVELCCLLPSLVRQLFHNRSAVAADSSQ